MVAAEPDASLRLEQLAYFKMQHPFLERNKRHMEEHPDASPQKRSTDRSNEVQSEAQFDRSVSGRSGAATGSQGIGTKFHSQGGARDDDQEYEEARRATNHDGDTAGSASHRDTSASHRSDGESDRASTARGNNPGGEDEEMETENDDSSEPDLAEYFGALVAAIEELVKRPIHRRDLESMPLTSQVLKELNE